VPPPEVVVVRSIAEVLERVIANRLQHRVARFSAGAFALDDQALVDKRSNHVEVGVAHGLRSWERPAADEDWQPGEEVAFAGVEEAVAPLDRRTQGLLPARPVAGAAGQEVQALIEPSEEFARRQHLHARRRELEREGETVEASADRPHHALVLRREPEIGPHGVRTVAEERHGLVLRECAKRVLLLGFDVERLAARRQRR
jgi:hypothetical protein